MQAGSDPASAPATALPSPSRMRSVGTRDTVFKQRRFEYIRIVIIHLLAQALTQVLPFWKLHI